MKQFLSEIISEAGRRALDYHQRLSELAVTNKSDTELVTEADKAIEDFLVARIKERYPEHGIYGEETGRHEGQECRWLIDPIDGTTSFVHGLSCFCVSIAVEKDGELILGMVNAPALGEMFEAEKGKGAFLNGEAIRVSERSSLKESVVATSLGCYGFEPGRDNLDYILGVKPRVRNIRIFGSAALHCCYVAAGRLEGYWQPIINHYDVAAGMLMVSEAGGKYSDLRGKTGPFSNELMATNGTIHDEMAGIFQKVKK